MFPLKRSRTRSTSSRVIPSKLPVDMMGLSASYEVVVAPRMPIDSYSCYV